MVGLLTDADVFGEVMPSVCGKRVLSYSKRRRKVLTFDG